MMLLILGMVCGGVRGGYRESLPARDVSGLPTTGDVQCYVPAGPHTTGSSVLCTLPEEDVLHDVVEGFEGLERTLLLRTKKGGGSAEFPVGEIVGFELGQEVRRIAAPPVDHYGVYSRNLECDGYHCKLRTCYSPGANLEDVMVVETLPAGAFVDAYALPEPWVAPKVMDLEAPAHRGEPGVVYGKLLPVAFPAPDGGAELCTELPLKLRYHAPSPAFATVAIEPPLCVVKFDGGTGPCTFTGLPTYFPVSIVVPQGEEAHTEDVVQGTNVVVVVYTVVIACVLLYVGAALRTKDVRDLRPDHPKSQ